MTYAPIPDVPQQVSSYLGDLNNGNATVAATSSNKTLVTFWGGRVSLQNLKTSAESAAGMEQLMTVWEAAIGSNPENVQATATAGIDTMVASISVALSWLISASPNVKNRPDFALISLPQGDLLPEIASLAGNNASLISIFKNLSSHFNDGLANVAAALNSTAVYTLNADTYVDFLDR